MTLPEESNTSKASCGILMAKRLITLTVLPRFLTTASTFTDSLELTSSVEEESVANSSDVGPTDARTGAITQAPKKSIQTTDFIIGFAPSPMLERAI